MQIQLSGKAAEIVKEQVASGFYGSAAEFVSDIVLRADEFNRLKLERLWREVNIGLEEIKRGEVVEFDEEVYSTQNQEPIAKLVSISGAPAKPKKLIKAGSAKGLIKIADDCVDEIDELDYIENLGVPRPCCFVGPFEWTGNDQFLPLEERKNAQKLSGCYAFCAVLVESNNLIDDDEWALQEIKFLYIGKAVRLRSRMSEHEGIGTFNKCFDWCQDKDQTLESNRVYFLMVAFWFTENRAQLEAELIKKLKPVFNVRQE